LQLVAARAAESRSAHDQGHSRGDRGPVPAPALLVGEQDQATGPVEPRARAGTVQPDQREQAQHLRFRGHQPREQRREPFGILGQVPALRAVARAGEVAFASGSR
jgi:hypothetical protein